MSEVELHFGAATDVGRVREVNEDSYLARPPVFVVADGMGGHDGGDVASRIVVEQFERLAEVGYDPRRGTEVVARTLAEAHERIEAYAAQQGAAAGRDWYAGTTAVAAVLVEGDDGPQWLVANLGDSRAYRMIAGTLEQVSVDHSLVQELVDAGAITEADAAVHPERHVVTRALGGPERAEADFFVLPFADAERLLLCSDGINGMLGHADVEGILDGVEDPRDAADRVVAAAVEAGGQDNATAVVVDVVGWSPSAAGPDDEGQRVDR